MLAIANDTFDPVLLSLEENQFLIDHLGKAPAVVRRVPVPPGVNPKAVYPVIEELYALAEVEKADGVEWSGFDAVRDRCKTYLAQIAQWGVMKQRAGKTFPTHPSMAEWDGRGRPRVGASGSDAHRVRTYFDESGQRQKFAVSLHDEGPAFQVPWSKSVKVYTALVVDEEKGSITCPICNHAETFDHDSPSAMGMAKTRMARHLTSAKKDIEAHRALHTKVYA